MSELVADSSLVDALDHIDRLEDLLGKTVEDQPCVEGQVGSLQYNVDFNTNFEDRNGFITGVARYMEEATVQTALNELLEEGDLHAVNLYTWRCCTRGVPQSASNEDPNRERIHSTTVEVLSPEVEKLYNLVRFQKIAIERFSAEVKILCQVEKRKEFVSSAYLLTLGKFINMFAILDELKNIKASVKIDFSSFRRAAQVLRMLSDSQKLQESQNLSVFLATPNKIRANLSEALEKIQNSEEVLADVISICVNMFDQQLFVTVEEKHMLVKVIGFCVALLDESRQLYKLDTKGRVNIDRIDRIFSSLPIVPLFGDMQIFPFSYVSKSPFFDSSKWPLCSAGNSDSPCPIDLVKLLPQITQDHMRYAAELQYRCLIFDNMSHILNRKTEEDDEAFYRLALKGLRLLSEWTSTVLELHSWKLVNPTDSHQNKECPMDAEEYERATTYNYSAKEKSALVKIIGMIKGLQGLLSKHENILGECIRRHVYQKLQNFVQKTLRDAVRKSVKHKRHVLNSVLTSIRDACAEWATDAALPANDPATRGEKSPLNVQTLKRAVGPSSTQLYLVRTMVESIISEKMCARRHLRKDVDQGHLPLIEEFHRISFFWGYLLNFGLVLTRCCDLAALWYREFYLEMTMGRRVQFPIEMSMPWILIDHILENPDLIEFAMYSFDLYNDSANWALHLYKKQWLFDELIAEVNLSLDQFLFKLSSQIFKYYKQLAATDLLPRKVRNDWAIATDEKLTVNSIKYEGIIMQRRAHVLGHYLDMNELIRQRISVDMLQSLQAAIDKFEEGSITLVVLFDALLRVNKETHKVLSKWFPSLDNYEHFWKEANQTVSARHGRTTIHICKEMSNDFIADFCYNLSTNRFVRSAGKSRTKITERQSPKPMPTVYLFGSRQLNTVYSTLYSSYTGFIGEPHFKAIADILGYDGLGVVITQLMSNCENLINGVLSEWVLKIKDRLPLFLKTPDRKLMEEGIAGLIRYYKEVLGSLVTDQLVKSELFQYFREVGNSVLFALLVEQCLTVKETWMTCQAFPFQGTMKDSNQEEDPPVDSDKMKKIALVKALHVYGNIDKLGTEVQRKLAKEADTLSGELLSMGLRIFPGILRKIKKILLLDETEQNIWTGPPPMNHVMNMHRNWEFHRVWSALQFICCIPVRADELNVEQLYGDSPQWAACLFIGLLGQEARFKIFDYSYELWNAYQNGFEDHPKSVSRINVERLMARIRSHQLLAEKVFDVVSKVIDEPNRYELVTTGRSREYAKCFLPPVHKSLMTTEDIPQDVVIRLPDAVKMVRQQRFPSELPPPPTDDEVELVLESAVSSEGSIEISHETTAADFTAVGMKEIPKINPSLESAKLIYKPKDVVVTVDLIQFEDEPAGPFGEKLSKVETKSAGASKEQLQRLEAEPIAVSKEQLVQLKAELIGATAEQLVKLETEAVSTFVEQLKGFEAEAASASVEQLKGFEAEVVSASVEQLTGLEAESVGPAGEQLSSLKSELVAAAEVLSVKLEVEPIGATGEQLTKLEPEALVVAVTEVRKPEINDAKRKTAKENLNLKYFEDMRAPQSTGLVTKETEGIVAVHDEVSSTVDILFQAEQNELDSASVSSVIDAGDGKLLSK